jgi:hypothetical protein
MIRESQSQSSSPALIAFVKARNMRNPLLILWCDIQVPVSTMRKFSKRLQILSQVLREDHVILNNQVTIADREP